MFNRDVAIKPNYIVNVCNNIALFFEYFHPWSIQFMDMEPVDMGGLTVYKIICI